MVDDYKKSADLSREQTTKSNNYREYIERRENSRKLNDSLANSRFESRYLTKQDEMESTLA